MNILPDNPVRRVSTRHPYPTSTVRKVQGGAPAPPGGNRGGSPPGNPPGDAGNDPLTPREIADMLRVHVHTVTNWLRLELMVGHKVGRQWRVWRKDFIDFLRRTRYTLGIEGIGSIEDDDEEWP